MPKQRSRIYEQRLKSAELFTADSDSFSVLMSLQYEKDGYLVIEGDNKIACVRPAAFPREIGGG